ncbi:unnamed protein product [Rotaria sordida]|uniref:AMP-dependent synthetase/ligase domain-containing protein n=2 Tax=Rotaria sordida TaxID=392033 RepID=A0A813WV14_9BILA|nr:unnamed protein product [Rotaria sordida]
MHISNTDPSTENFITVNSSDKMTVLFGPNRPDLLRHEVLGQIFIRTALQYPNKVALLWQNEKITYYQLYQQAMEMAIILYRTRHVGPGSIVGIRLSRSAQLHVTILAVLFTGACYAPFDADAPDERVIAVLADIEATLLLVDSQTSMNHSLAVDIETLKKHTISDHIHLSLNIDPKSIAYIICTSGSTGKPKAIAITHSNICHFIRADNEIMKITKDDIVYQGFSAAFDGFFMETFAAYLVGATLAIPSKSDLLNTDRIHVFLIDHAVTVLSTVPTLLLLINNDPALRLRLINIGGESCPQAVVDRWWKEDRRIINQYGPSETTVAATTSLLYPGEQISIGAPLPNYVCCLLDEETGQPTTASTGELCIRGPGMALGYFRNNSLTKQKFTEYGYRTGDRVTFDQGRIYFHKRIDSQVKIRGFRIELTEIEEELLKLHGDVQSAAVAFLNGQLVAFILGQLNETTMRTELGKRLPRYMIPNRLIHVKGAIPRMASGKIDRKALSALFVDESKKMSTHETRIDIGELIERDFVQRRPRRSLRQERIIILSLS